ncbi:MAG: hypothetical protein ACRBBM_01600 [Pseudomonadaceae bacterium]
MLTIQLLNRGDGVYIERGRLVIQPASGKAAPLEWMTEHAPRIHREILAEVGLDAYEYVTYTTGHYGKARFAGITLQFVSVLTGRPAYAIFNADLTRQRTTAKGKAGAPLPRGQFRVGKRSHFYKFWLNAGIRLPKRLGAFHDYMGKLRGVLFTAHLRGERIDAGSLMPLALSELQLRTQLLPDISQTTVGQVPDNSRTTAPDKEFSPDYTPQGIQPDPTKGPINCGNTVIREHGYTGSSKPALSVLKAPQEQSVDDWLEEYENA